MEKSGAIHVDWAVSIALFLMFVIGMLLLFRPGVLPVYNGEFLTGLVEDELFHYSSFEYQSVPLSFTTNPQNVPPAVAWTHARVNFSDTLIFPFCDQEKSHYTLFYANGSFVPSDQYFINVRPNPSQVLCNEKGIPLPNNDVRMIFGGLAPSTEYSFVLVYSPDTKVYGTGSQCGSVTCSDVPIANVQEGIRVVEKGVSAERLAGVLGYIDVNYSDSKETIKFPKNKEFRVCEKVVSDESCHPSSEIPADVNVYSRSISSAVINGTNGDIIGRVDLIIQTW